MKKKSRRERCKIKRYIPLKLFCFNYFSIFFVKFISDGNKFSLSRPKSLV